MDKSIPRFSHREDRHHALYWAGMAQTAQSALKAVEEVYRQAKIRILAVKEKRKRLVAEGTKRRDIAKAEAIRARIQRL